MKISILLPYKENFSPIYAGAVSLFVKDTVKISKYRKNVTVYGNTNIKNIYKLSYKNIFLKKNIIESGSKIYVYQFLKYEKESPSDIIEIYNRPNYFHLIFNETKNKKLILYFHNDPLTMTGSRSITDRKKLLNLISVEEFLELFPPEARNMGFQFFNSISRFKTTTTNIGDGLD